jgi:hypothetical protein
MCVFLSPSNKGYLKVRHNHPLIHYLNSLFFNNPTIRRYIVWATDSVVKQITDKSCKDSLIAFVWDFFAEWLTGACPWRLSATSSWICLKCYYFIQSKTRLCWYFFAKMFWNIWANIQQHIMRAYVTSQTRHSVASGLNVCAHFHVSVLSLHTNKRNGEHVSDYWNLRSNWLWYKGLSSTVKSSLNQV